MERFGRGLNSNPVIFELRVTALLRFLFHLRSSARTLGSRVAGSSLLGRKLIQEFVFCFVHCGRNRRRRVTGGSYQ